MEIKYNYSGRESTFMSQEKKYGNLSTTEVVEMRAEVRLQQK